MHDEHRDPDDPFSPAEGPDPSDEDADLGEALETYISDMDRPVGSFEHVTAAEQLAGDTIDDRTKREQPQRERPPNRLDVSDEGDPDTLDEEGALVGREMESFGPEAPEIEAMHIVDDAPGHTDHADDYVQD